MLWDYINIIVFDIECFESLYVDNNIIIVIFKPCLIVSCQYLS